MSEYESESDTLSELLELTKENNRILRKMHRNMLWSQVFTYVYWLLILGVMGWSYYLVQPYLVTYLEAYQKLVNTISAVDAGNTSLPNLQGLLEKIK